MSQAVRVHVVAGGFPPGSVAGHDMDYARMRILELLQEKQDAHATVSNDFEDVHKWLPGSQLMITYVAGPYLNDAHSRFVRDWLEAGGRWLALHGTSGGKAARVSEQSRARKMVKLSHHATLGCFFLCRMARRGCSDIHARWATGESRISRLAIAIRHEIMCSLSWTPA